MRFVRPDHILRFGNVLTARQDLRLVAEDGLPARKQDSLVKASLPDHGKGGLYFARFNVRIDSLAQQRYERLNDSYTLLTKSE
jgi:hypothetical protein